MAWINFSVWRQLIQGLGLGLLDDASGGAVRGLQQGTQVVRHRPRADVSGGGASHTRIGRPVVRHPAVMRLLSLLGTGSKLLVALRHGSTPSSLFGEFRIGISGTLVQSPGLLPYVGRAPEPERLARSEGVGLLRPPATLLSMSRRLLLWDVDGTLLWTGPATRQAFDRAVASVLRQAVGDHEVSFGGKTDEARRQLPGVLQALEREMELAVDLLRQDGRVLPGVLELLERFDRRPDVVQSVLTGNTEANARLKVGAFGLDRYLDLEVAAFGSDNADRNALVSVALEKLERLRGLRVPPGDVWVIGDTPLDLACARAAGARCLLVATGRVPIDELSQAGADAGLPDLSDTRAVERLLLSSAAMPR